MKWKAPTPHELLRGRMKMESILRVFPNIDLKWADLTPDHKAAWAKCVKDEKFPNKI